MPSNAYFSPPHRLHLGSFLFLNYSLGYLFALEPKVLKTVVILGSQKIISTGVALASFLDGVGDKGLMTVPIIVGVLPQLFIAACMVPCWVRPDDRSGNFAACKLTTKAHGKTSTESLRTNGLAPETDGVGEEVRRLERVAYVLTRAVGSTKW